MLNKLRVVCLPIAGEKNPYQKLMMEGLNESGFLKAYFGCSGKIFPLLRTRLKYQPDFIHVDWIHQYYLRRSTFLSYVQFCLFVMDVVSVKFILRTKLVWTLHNIIPHDHSFNGPSKLARRFFARNCSRIRVFSANSIKNACSILNLAEDKFSVFPEGSYAEYYKNDIDRSKARDELNLPKKAKVFLYLGFIKPYKGLISLVESFQKINYSGEAVLLIVGEVKNKDYFEKLKIISGNSIIYRPQFILDDSLQVYFNAANVVVLPFDKIENSGSVILAMGFKKAIIAPNTGVLSERLQEQSELLYSHSITEGLNQSWSKSVTELDNFGQKNFEILKKYKWEDFSTFFK